MNFAETRLSVDDHTFLVQLSTLHRVPLAHMLVGDGTTNSLAILFSHAPSFGSNIWSVGYLFPELEMAAHRSGLTTHELIGESPFHIDPNLTAEKPIRSNDIIWISNPNRISGANMSLTDLRDLCALVPSGMVCIDERFVEQYGITALPLLSEHDRVAVIRTVDGNLDLVMLSLSLLLYNDMRDEFPVRAISESVRAIVMEQDRESAMCNAERCHDESLRLALQLNQAGIRCRITATDFLLLHVSDPTETGNYLARYRVRFENVSGYPGMRGYLKYPIQSPRANERLLEAARRMPDELKSRRALPFGKITLRRPTESSASLGASPVAPWTEKQSGGVVARRRHELVLESMD